jgi:TonB-linked SusC/RagA family outer membrane protein
MINCKILWKIFFILCVCGCSLSAFAQGGKVKGRVIDTDGEALPGATISVVGSTRAVMADENGNFDMDNIPSGTKLLVSFLGMKPKEIQFKGEKELIFVLEQKIDELEEVTIVAFGAQKKNSVVSSISTIKPSDLKVPSSNLTTALAGRIAGVISYQRTGEPGMDNAEFFIRGVTTFGVGKKDPLILIDQVEMTTDDLARLVVDDIASFSIMKDANATALYGARGANGVILVTTKEGKEGAIKVQVRLEGSHSSPTRTMDYADPVTYMRLQNEAVYTRWDGDPGKLVPRYTTQKILNTEKGYDPIRYPATDWQDLLFNDNTFNQRYNMNVSGGGKVARYYVAASYSRDNGIIKMDKRNNFNSNIRINRYVLRSNINLSLTKTTEAVVRLHGAFDDYSGPFDGGTDLYKKALNANPVLFPPYYPADQANAAVKHILFGNYDDAHYMNPYAEMVTGYKDQNRSNMLAQFEAKQNLDFLTKGLSIRGLFNVNRFSLLEHKNGYSPYYYGLVDDPNIYELKPLNPSGGSEAVIQKETPYKDVVTTMYFEGAAQYNRTFAEKHDLSGLLVYTLREQLEGSAEGIQAALPHRNLGLAGRVTYGYDSRYFIEANFGYNGSERFAKDERFGFFPSIGAGWIVSNESFMEPLRSTLSKLKLKATYGLVGNDEIGSSSDRFFYISEMTDNDDSRGYTFGNNFNYHRPGVSVSRYGDPLITWEISKKTNLGVELNLWNNLEIQVDWFRENRSNILQLREDVPITMGLQVVPKANVGKAKGGGVDMSVDYNKSFTKDLWTVFRGNFTYASSKYVVYEEPNYSETPWLSHVGRYVSQQWGYVAERFFVDDAEVAASPKQIGNYYAGDLKYKDINGDMIIDASDRVPIGYPTTPEINYGFGISAGYKNFDISCFFQGSARSSFWIDASATAPFIGDRAMLKYWADSHWSESDRDLFALWPRLSETIVDNNVERNTWFMRDGTFIRFKTAEVGYTLPKRWLAPVQLKNVRLYANGSNLFVISVFKMWDPEMAGNGLAYPLQRVLNFGVNVEF